MVVLSSKIKLKIHNREIKKQLPHLGILFRITEDAIAIIFVEMGLLSITKRKI